MVLKAFFNTLRLIRNSKDKFEMKKDCFVWIDLEMSGLNPDVHKIMEIACLVTTPNLNVLDEGINIVIHQSDEDLSLMNDWCQKQHTESGLVDQCRKSNISLSQAENILLNYIKKHHKEGTLYPAGNSVYMDLLFIKKYLPSVNSLFHYRLIDVSSIKVLAQHWYPQTYENLPRKKLSHRALDDIKESIEELKNYKKLMFK